VEYLRCAASAAAVDSGVQVLNIVIYASAAVILLLFVVLLLFIINVRFKLTGSRLIACTVHLNVFCFDND